MSVNIYLMQRYAQPEVGKKESVRYSVERMFHILSMVMECRDGFRNCSV